MLNRKALIAVDSQHLAKQIAETDKFTGLKNAILEQIYQAAKNAKFLPDGIVTLKGVQSYSLVEMA